MNETASKSLLLLTFSCLDTIPAYDRQTDGRTDGQARDDSKYRASIASRGKNWPESARVSLYSCL